MVAKILTLIKGHKLITALVGAVLVLIFINGTSSCSIKSLQNKINLLNGQIDSLSFANSKLEQSNKDLELVNTKLLEDNAKHDLIIVKLEKDIAAGLATIHQLEGTISSMSVPEDCKPLVVQYQALVKKWSDQFSLAIADRDEWKVKYSNLLQAYDNRGKELDNTKTIIINKDKIILDKDSVIKKTQKQLKIRTFEMNVYRAAGAAAVVIVALKLLKAI